MFFTPNLVIGLTIMAVGLALLLDTLGVRDLASMMKYWPALIVLFGASLVAQAFHPVAPATPRKAQSGVPCFFLFLLAVAMFWTFGLPGIETSAAGLRISAAGVMGKAQTTGTGDVRSGRVAAVMGRSSLDLRQVQLGPGEEMIVDVFVAMGRADVRIPDHWVVDWSALPIMGSLDEERIVEGNGEIEEAEPGTAERAEKQDDQPDRRDTAATLPPATGAPAGTKPPRLKLRGVVMMGKVEVTS